MFRLVTIHNDAHFGFQFPAVAVYIQNNRVHPEILRCFLAAQTSSQAIVEKHEDYRLVVTEILPCERSLFHLFRFFEGLPEITYIAYIQELFHTI